MTKNFKKLGSRICLNDFFFTFESLFCILSLSGLRKKTNSFYMSKTSVRSANLESYAFYFFLFIANLDFFFFFKNQSGKWKVAPLLSLQFFLFSQEVRRYCTVFFFFFFLGWRRHCQHTVILIYTFWLIYNFLCSKFLG